MFPLSRLRFRASSSGGAPGRKRLLGVWLAGLLLLGATGLTLRGAAPPADSLPPDLATAAIRAGEVGALTEAERHGLWLWESKGRCWRCHAGPNFTDEQFHNTGVGWGSEPPDWGRFAVTGKEEDRGKFKTPTLRGVAWTAPYMHDGSIATLEEVVEYYNRGGRANPHLDSTVAPLGLSKQEVQSLVAFLRALSEGEGPAGKLPPPK